MFKLIPFAMIKIIVLDPRRYITYLFLNILSSLSSKFLLISSRLILSFVSSVGSLIIGSNCACLVSFMFRLSVSSRTSVKLKSGKCTCIYCVLSCCCVVNVISGVVSLQFPFNFILLNKEITCMLNSQYPELSICQRL